MSLCVVSSVQWMYINELWLFELLIRFGAKSLKKYHLKLFVQRDLNTCSSRDDLLLTVSSVNFQVQQPIYDVRFGHCLVAVYAENLSPVIV